MLWKSLVVRSKGESLIIVIVFARSIAANSTAT